MMGGLKLLVGGETADGDGGWTETESFSLSLTVHVAVRGNEGVAQMFSIILYRSAREVFYLSGGRYRQRRWRGQN